MALEPVQFPCTLDPLDNITVAVEPSELSVQISFGRYGDNVVLSMGGIQELSDYLARVWYYLSAIAREGVEDDVDD